MRCVSCGSGLQVRVGSGARVASAWQICHPQSRKQVWTDLDIPQSVCWVLGRSRSSRCEKADAFCSEIRLIFNLASVQIMSWVWCHCRPLSQRETVLSILIRATATLPFLFFRVPGTFSTPGLWVLLYSQLVRLYARVDPVNVLMSHSHKHALWYYLHCVDSTPSILFFWRVHASLRMFCLYMPINNVN